MHPAAVRGQDRNTRVQLSLCHTALLFTCSISPHSLWDDQGKRAFPEVSPALTSVAVQTDTRAVALRAGQGSDAFLVSGWSQP